MVQVACNVGGLSQATAAAGVAMAGGGRNSEAHESSSRSRKPAVFPTRSTQGHNYSLNDAISSEFMEFALLFSAVMREFSMRWISQQFLELEAGATKCQAIRANF